MDLNLPIHPTRRHPLTGQPLQAVGFSKRGPIWPVMGAAEDDETGDDGGEGQGKPREGSSGAGDGSKAQKAQGADLGFPRGTPVAEMEPDEQVAYWKHQARKHEGRNNGWQQVAGDRSADQLKADLEELAEIRKSKLTPSEKQIEEAKEAARAEARAEFAPQLAKMAFVTALSHVKEEDRNELIEDLNLSKFVNDKGEVDMEAVAKTAARIAPDTGTPRKVDFGGGRRTSTKTSAADQGREEARRRYGDKSKATA